MAEFHFLRPLWLLLLPLAIWAAWRAGLGRAGVTAGAASSTGPCSRTS